jgi:flavin reductase (DIM6/NTAB) family NADH-FMN oxidoreductase RutF/DNA-binding IclR family transcriptional regulator
MTDTNQYPQVDPLRYRQVLGQYPTGVCAITAMRNGSEPVAMVVGSFASVSLNPPLIAFFPDRASSSWSKLRDCDDFCVNILSAEQEPLCRKLASKSPDKFAGTPHRISARGNPILDGVVSWIECHRYSISDAGDHELVIGRVLALDIETADLPLLFFQGGYGRFAPASVSTLELSGLSLDQLRCVDHARPELEALSDEISARCLAIVRIGAELAIVASAGRARHDAPGTLVGQRLPFVPPTGSIFAAWLPDSELDAWIGRVATAERQQAVRAALQRVRSRGYSLGLLNEAQREFSSRLRAIAAGQTRGSGLEALIDALYYDPEILTHSEYDLVRVISAPVFDRKGRVAFVLTLYDFPKPTATNSVESYIERVVEGAVRLTKKIAGSH